MDLLPAVPADDPGNFSWWQLDVRATSKVGIKPTLDRKIDADVAIVGGGFTGLWTAIALKERSPKLRIVVLDAYRCGDGASSRNGGNVHGYWGALPTLISFYGADKALEAARLGTLAQKKLRAFATSKPNDVWWVEEGYLRVATSEAQKSKLAAFITVARELGVPDTVRRVGKSDLLSLCNSPKFEEGLFFSEGATVHPARLAAAVREKAIQLGIDIYENTPVISVQQGSPCFVATSQGGVTARDVVLANYTGTMAIPSVGRTTTLFSSFPAMSERNELELERIGYKAARGIADLRMFTHYFRRTRDGRILMGTGSGPIGFGNNHSAAALRRDEPSLERAKIGLRRFFPGMSAVVSTWGFPIEVTSDRLPYFGTAAGTRIHYGSGYSGHGVNATVIAGECLASIVLGEKDQWSNSVFCNRTRVNFPLEPFRYVGGSIIRNAIVKCEDAQDAGLPQPLVARGIAEVPRMIGMRIGMR
ncbi:FAD-dependent oxidoreductase [Rhizobium sp. Root1203]|uniref:FAD-dependent oxidoreductase n=1 Tax=Rhizobium sp. Root1203 TaxID=1736427 RepID=UPI00070D9C0A|nr:FAD-dependent oxidoreductase [Rhizobium sp. Root1203]KQV27123.1 FAD-dependent oxidoreductase [Rhizobium sp. Root1203]